MRWPWVGVGRLDDAHAERDWLRAELSAAQDHIRRMQRRAEGLPEIPKKEKPSEPMPDDIRAMCDAWSSPDMQRRERKKAETLYTITGSWDRVREKMQPAEVEP